MIPQCKRCGEEMVDLGIGFRCRWCDPGSFSLIGSDHRECSSRFQRFMWEAAGENLELEARIRALREEKQEMRQLILKAALGDEVYEKLVSNHDIEDDPQ